MLHKGVQLLTLSGVSSCDESCKVAQDSENITPPSPHQNRLEEEGGGCYSLKNECNNATTLPNPCESKELEVAQRNATSCNYATLVQRFIGTLQRNNVLGDERVDQQVVNRILANAGVSYTEQATTIARLWLLLANAGILADKPVKVSEEIYSSYIDGCNLLELSFGTTSETTVERIHTCGVCGCSYDKYRSLDKCPFCLERG